MQPMRTPLKIEFGLPAAELTRGRISPAVAAAAMSRKARLLKRVFIWEMGKGSLKACSRPRAPANDYLAARLSLTLVHYPSFPNSVWERTCGPKLRFGWRGCPRAGGAVATPRKPRRHGVR